MHIHWPEAHLRHSRRSLRILKRFLFLIFLARSKIVGTTIIRTVHNLKPHEQGDRVEQLLVEVVDSLTSGFIRMNSKTPVARSRPSRLIPLGHYRDWLGDIPDISPIPGRLLFFGVLRANKGISDLVRAFGEVPKSVGISLHVAGMPGDAGTSDLLVQASQECGSITADLRYLEDDNLQREILKSEAVILPYPELHNSGVLLLAVSLNRMVVVPESEVSSELADEIGPEWISRFSGPLTADVLCAGPEQARRLRRQEPDLSGREWVEIASKTFEFYRAVHCAKREDVGIGPDPS